MSAGQVWRRRDGQLWAEVQVAALDASGWRLMVPLVDAPDAVDAPPLVVTIDRWRARVHLATGVPERVLGEAIGTLTVRQTEALQDAVAGLVTRPG